MSHRLRINLLRVLVVVVVLSGWQAIVEFDVMNERTLASPTQIARAIPKVLDHPEFGESLRLTLWQTELTFVLAMVIGTVLGILMSAYRSLRKAFQPYIILGNSFPTVLL